VFVTGGASWLSNLEGQRLLRQPGRRHLCHHPADRGATGDQYIHEDRLERGRWLEWMWSRNWMIRGEYRYSDYGTFSSISSASASGATSDSVAPT